jgi:hypothetical protein
MIYINTGRPGAGYISSIAHVPDRPVPHSGSERREVLAV